MLIYDGKRNKMNVRSNDEFNAGEKHKLQTTFWICARDAKAYVSSLAPVPGSSFGALALRRRVRPWRQTHF